MNKIFISLFISLIFSNVAWSGESCNALLNLGLYNVSQSSNAADGQFMGLSTFCSADYSSSSTSSEQKAAIKGAFGWFSAGASGSVSDSEIIIKQSEVCTSGFNSSSYSNQASSYAKTIYQGALDAWNQCNSLSLKGLNFDVKTSSTLQGITVIITPASGVIATFRGLYQDGAGISACKTTLPPTDGSTKGIVVNVNTTSFFKMSAAQKLTINCKRIMKTDLQGNLYADAQDLIFVTSSDSLRVPMAATGSLSRATVDQALASIKTAVEDAVSQKTETKIEETLKTAVVAFNSTSCPAGWADVPALYGRFIIGTGAGTGLTPRNLGDTGGLEKQTLTVAEMPPHTHTMVFGASDKGGNGNGYAYSDNAGGSTVKGTYVKETNSVGSGQAFSVTPPFYALHYCVKL